MLTIISPAKIRSRQVARCASQVALILFLVVASCPAQEVWQSHLSNAPEWLSGVAFGGGVYVACGEVGVISTSPDGETWTARSSGTLSTLRGIAYGNGRFVAVGQLGVCTTSTDGVSWTAGSTGIVGTFASGVAFGDGVFVACGSGGLVSRSTDGTNWTPAASGATTSFLQNISYGDGVFVAVGASGLLVRSTDQGLSWQRVTRVNSRHLQGIAYGDGRFMAVGQSAVVLVSEDGGASWTRLLHGVTTKWMRSVSANGGTFVAVGDDGDILTSSGDLSSWQLPDSTVSIQLSGVQFCGGKFIAVGEKSAGDGTLISSQAPVVETPFGSWSAVNFSEAELLDDSVSGPAADPDCDGIANFLEFALGLNPKLADAGSEADPVLEIVAGGDSALHLAIKFQRPTDLVGVVSYGMKTSTSLDHFQEVASSEEILTDDGTTQTVRVTEDSPIPATSRTCFAQLSVSEP